MGSTRAALRAGRNAAAVATAIISTALAIIVTGSVGFKPDTPRIAIRAARIPKAIPIAT
jgi:hypothetical protein